MKTVQDLQKYLSSINKPISNYKIAVGCLLFNSDNRLILLKRGVEARDEQGKLEGVGGEVMQTEKNLLKALLREIKEEIGEVEVKIDQLLGVKILPGKYVPYWVVVDYLGRLMNGIPNIQDKSKVSAIEYISLENVIYNNLSPYQKVTMNSYKNKFGNYPYYL